MTSRVIRVSVRVIGATGDPAPTTHLVPSGSPVGAMWSHAAVADGANPPAHVAYVLNGNRTVPSAWLGDGDELVIALEGEV